MTQSTRSRWHLSPFAPYGRPKIARTDIPFKLADAKLEGTGAAATLARQSHERLSVALAGWSSSRLICQWPTTRKNLLYGMIPILVRSGAAMEIVTMVRPQKFIHHDSPHSGCAVRCKNVPLAPAEPQRSRSRASSNWSSTWSLLARHGVEWRPDFYCPRGI
jgi:hypothetical protein